MGNDTGGLRVSVVIPVYGGQATLTPLVERLLPVLEEHTAWHEILFVSDASPDGSWDVIRSLAQQHKTVAGLELMRNSGQHNALLAGIRAAKGDVIVTMDDDLQNPPEEVPRILAALTEDVDVVYGTPKSQRHGVARSIASTITRVALSQAVGADAARHASAFRAFRTRLRGAFAEYTSPYSNIDVLLSWGTTRFSHIEVRQDARRFGTSGYNWPKLLSHAINMITGFTVRPLQFASVLGFGFTALGIALLGYVTVQYVLDGSAVPGFPFLASAIAVFSGIQLFALGVLGEYLARVHLRTMGRPGFVVRRATSESEN